MFRLRPPRVNADEINDAVLCNGKPSATCTFPPALAANGTADPRQLMIQEVDIDAAEAYYDITLTGSPPSSGVALALAVPSTVAAAGFVPVTSVACAGSTPGTTSTCLTVARNDILSTVKLSAAVVESFATADAYYKTVDAVTGIGASRETLNAWLIDNCFSLTQVGYGADLSATYLNNFDLGFGREMYFKTDCATGTTGATIDTAHGERASIVYNYTSLEGAIQRTSPFLAVAMEFRADAGDPARRKYTRFYTFAPNADGSGWTRVRSANFDGRGEKFTPGNCTVCHGGKPRDLTAAYSAHQTGGTPIAAATADLGAQFLPWDLKSLLFADTGSGTDVDTTLAPGYLANDQAPHISDLNLKGALSTMIDQAGDSTNGAQRRGNLRALVCSYWYGGTLASAVPANQQSAVPVCNGAGSYNPAASGWPTTPNAGGKYSPDQLYTKVIAQQCRSCHMQRISEPDYSQTAAAGALVDAVAPQFAQYADLALRVTDGFSNPAGNTVLHDMQSGILFRRHVMPGSRLTSDRFWAGFGAPADPSCTLAGKTTAACVLAQYFDATKSDQDFVPAPDPVTSVIADNPPPVPAAGPITSSAFGSGPGAGSALASSFSWTLAVPATAPAGAVPRTPCCRRSRTRCRACSSATRRRRSRSSRRCRVSTRCRCRSTIPSASRAQRARARRSPLTAYPWRQPARSPSRASVRR